MKSNQRDKVKGLISCIMPSYNRAYFLEERINELIEQTYNHWELIIVNDCSTDHTVEITQSLIQKDNRVKLINLHKNSGSVSIPRAIGIVESNGEFLCPSDDDVMILPNKLEDLALTLNENKHALLAYGNRYEGKFSPGGELSYWEPQVMYNWDPLKPCGWGVDNGQIMYRESVYKNIDIQFPKRGCDWELAKQIAEVAVAAGIKAEGLVHCDEFVCLYLWHDKNRSLNESTKTKEIFPADFACYLDDKGYSVNYGIRT